MPTESHAHSSRVQYHARLDPDRYSPAPVETIAARYRNGRQHRLDDGAKGITLVAESGGEIVGFIDARLERSPDAMHREMIYCHVAEIAVSSGTTIKASADN